MTDGSRILRTVAVPLVVALIFLFLVPKTCQKAIGSRKLRLPGATATDAAPPADVTPPADGALHIKSDSPDAQPLRPVHYPAGLEAQRVQYLIEIDQHFAEPLVLRIPKPGGVSIGETTAADALVRAGYLESADGGYMPARGAALHLEGMTEEPLAWRVPVATRKFRRVTSLEDSGEGKAKVGFTWQWEPNEAGRAVKSSFDLHQAKAEFGGGGEHPWDLNSVSVDSDWR